MKFIELGLFISVTPLQSARFEDGECVQKVAIGRRRVREYLSRGHRGACERNQRRCNCRPPGDSNLACSSFQSWDRNPYYFRSSYLRCYGNIHPLACGRLDQQFYQRYRKRKELAQLLLLLLLFFGEVERKA